MAFNGSGVYVRPGNSFDTPSSGTTIVSANAETFFSDLASALSNTICKDGQTTVTANLPMATYRHTGVSNATALTQYATADQVVDNSLLYGGASAAGTDTYAVSLSVSPGAYAAGQRYSFKADVANTGACTINFNAIGAASIKLQDGNDPYSNAIIANQIVEVEYDGTNMILLNPSFTGKTTTISGADVSSITVSGLSFTADKDIESSANVVISSTTTPNALNIVLNGDTTAANYRTVFSNNGGANTVASNPRFITSSLLATNDNLYVSIKISPNSTTGESIIYITYGGENSGIQSYGLAAIRYLSSDTITSIGIADSSSATVFASGTRLIVK